MYTKIKKGLKNAVPYLDGIHYSTLGGEPNIVGKISLDKKKDWTNGILENSRWALIYLSPDGVLDTIRMNGYSDFKTSNSQILCNELSFDVIYSLLTKSYQEKPKPIMVLGAGVQFAELKKNQLDLEI